MSIITILLASVVAFVGIGHFIESCKKKKTRTMIIGILFYTFYIGTLIWIVCTGSYKEWGL